MANKKGVNCRWHRYHLETNTKQIKTFPIGFDASELYEEGYTFWKIGSGPFSQEAYEKIVAHANTKVKGIPKSPETKAKMSAAQKGIPKSPENKKRMSEAQLARWSKK